MKYAILMDDHKIWEGDCVLPLHAIDKAEKETGQQAVYFVHPIRRTAEPHDNILYPAHLSVCQNCGKLICKDDSDCEWQHIKLDSTWIYKTKWCHL